MRILLFHPVLLPPRGYGGVERVVLWLAKGLAERGHEVWVGALPGSLLPDRVRLLAIDPRGASAHHLLARMKVLPSPPDVVHFMAPPEPGAWEQLPCAGILTVHGNGKPGEIFPGNTVFLSRNHAERHSASIYVHNGLDPGEFAYSAVKEGSLLFLSKTSWKVKNLAGAMRLCRKARVSLMIAGGDRPWSLRLQAALTPGFEWIGPVAGTRKASLLAQAKALVFPVAWEEPFGLVAAEAFFSGTPVIASPRGSLPELVPSEVGALPASEEAWVDALRAADSTAGRWASEACRAWAERMFHYSRMAESYEALYKRVASGEELHREAPRAEPIEEDFHRRKR